MTALIKRSPLAAAYRARGAAVKEIDSWEVAVHFGDPDAERRALAQASVLVDWSHIGKIRIRGADAADRAARWWPAAAGLAPLRAAGDASLAALRLARDEYLVLCEASRVDELLDGVTEGGSAIGDQSGALGALLLGGPQRGAVIERSAAMDLSPRAIGPGGALQTTLHGVPCAVYRSADWDLYLQTRDYTESLFDAFMDVGSGVGLVPAGLDCVPVNLSAGVGHG